MMRIIFIRHGETRWNSEGKLQGQLDIPLSDIGVNQIKLLPLRLKKEKIDLVFSSSLSRAYNTAKPIANYFDLGIISTTLLSERNFGVLQGVKLKEIDKDEKKKIILQKTIEPSYRPMMGESLLDLNKRIVKFLKFLNLFNTYKTVICVTHGGILDLLYRIAQNKPINTPRDWSIPNAGINIFEYRNQKLSLKHWADIDHLKAVTYYDGV